MAEGQISVGWLSKKYIVEAVALGGFINEAPNPIEVIEIAAIEMIIERKFMIVDDCLQHLLVLTISRWFQNQNQEFFNLHWVIPFPAF